MRELAEDDYEYSIDDALKSSDRPFSDWAQNVKNNNYSVSVVLNGVKYHSSIFLVLTAFCIFLIAVDACHN